MLRSFQPLSTESSSIHGQMRLPALSKSQLDELLAWGQVELPHVIDNPVTDETGSVISKTGFFFASSVEPPPPRGQSKTACLNEDNGLRENRRHSSVGAVPTAARRRRGVRKWVVGLVSPDPAKTTMRAIPAALQQLFEWVLRGLQQVSTVDMEASQNEPWKEWVHLPVDELILAALRNPDGELALLHSLVIRTIQILQSFSAHSSRNETLQWLFTATIWYMKGTLVAQAYIEHLLIPQVFACPIGGIPRITGMTVHLDEGSKEWYISTSMVMYVIADIHPHGTRGKQFCCVVQHTKRTFH